LAKLFIYYKSNRRYVGEMKGQAYKILLWVEKNNKCFLKFYKEVVVCEQFLCVFCCQVERCGV